MHNMKQFTKWLAASALFVSMTGCGHDPGERALSGAGIGAGAGVGAALLGAPLLPAVLVGGAVGAATGAATSDKQINLGK
jgi:osmotically inducible lipoprotein OsmB